MSVYLTNYLILCPLCRPTSAPTPGRSPTCAAGRAAAGGSPAVTSSPGTRGSTPGTGPSTASCATELSRGQTTSPSTWRGTPPCSGHRVTDTANQVLVAPSIPICCPCFVSMVLFWINIETISQTLILIIFDASNFWTFKNHLLKQNLWQIVFINGFRVMFRYWMQHETMSSKLYILCIYKSISYNYSLYFHKWNNDFIPTFRL